ncbi:MAG: TonB-dependent receptor [Candidatus Pseudobacter hemicellulosilyticus]|uniref:TonB-dependent receptor n=1 Tax=Candidatus Pseudobacter hemicellulosilyticus TaxID=3121375 RepID=A0AAJ5WP75_9BACT|nr:MAG: TonB-dependent receptor [Pseudobacter sp.]
MVRHIILVIGSILGLVHAAVSQYTLSGKVISSQKQAPVAFANLSVAEHEIWATADARGAFSLRDVPAGKIILTISYTGFQSKNIELEVSRGMDTLQFILEPSNLLLKEVMVTAKRKASSLGTSYLIDRTALDHMQLLNVAAATSLLPGFKTNRNQHLATSASQPIAVNGTSGEMGNALFGVAVEVDGTRIANSALPGMTGADMRNIASTNVESIEIVTGVASVEYGDMTNGLVKINTRKGKSPLIIDMMTKPNTKQVAVAKGFGLGEGNGVLNLSLEHTRSISDLTSPYTTYARNSLSLNYSNTFNQKSRQPLFLDIGITGNTGGYNSESDPDLFVNTYSKMNDHVLRGNLSLKWQLNKPWITNIELSGGLNYNDRFSETSSKKLTASSAPSVHATEEGYNVGQHYDENPNAAVILIPPGEWYEISYNDSKAFNYSGRLKANWNRNFGIVNNNLKLGVEMDKSSNNGRGNYYQDLRYAPDWREYRYDQFSNISNYALYAEDRVHIPLGQSSIRLVAGLRSDITDVKGSEYGTVGTLSPRFNGEYVFWEKAKRRVRDLSVRVGWGKSAKLPAFSVLFPQLSYRDIKTFSPGTTSDGLTYYAFYTMPSTRLFNPDLKWQYTIQKEISMSANIEGTRIMITAAQDKTFDSYDGINVFSPFTYKFTDETQVEKSAIPIANRQYTVDHQTGVVTITDKSGALPAETVPYKEITRYIGNAKAINGPTVLRRRLSWIIDFKEIRSIRTAFRVDGNYYYYRGVDETVTAYMPNTTQTMADGSFYKFVGYFTGGALSANGSLSRSLNMNVTATTHIPSIRLILSARLECSLYDFSRNLSERSNGQRGFVLDSRDEYLPSSSKQGVYGGNRFVGLYPDYYVSLDDMNTRIPFQEKFLWAKDNDPTLYNELARLVIKSNTDYYFNPNKVSAYYSANIGITKEIGELASVSFNAINFINNMARVRNSSNNTDASLFGSSYIPAFYYGLSCRLKI